MDSYFPRYLIVFVVVVAIVFVSFVVVVVAVAVVFVADFHPLVAETGRMIEFVVDVHHGSGDWAPVKE